MSLRSATAYRHRQKLWLAVGYAALLLGYHNSAYAKGDQHEPTLVQADKMSYDENTHIVTASGHVEVSQGDQILHADKIVYEQTKDVVHAVGHVSVLQPTGDVMFADQAELTNDMKQGFVDKVGMLFSDNSRMAARDAQRYEGRYLVADHGVYSACNLCVEHPDHAPLWQIEATRITHDNVSKDISYRDAVIEFAGIPVLYTPFFSHPDPTVKRRQGLLTPSGGYNANLGTFARVPYYFDLAPNTDLVVTPTFSANDTLQLGAEVRHRFENGGLQFSGSFTHADFVDEFGVDQGTQWRGNLFGNVLFNLSNIWRAGANVAFTSDKSYLQRYNITSDDQLVNRAFVEGFKGRDYAVANMYYFQDLRPGDQLTEPFVAPDMSFSALGDPGQTLGGRWSLDGGILVTNRDRGMAQALQGPDTRRVSLSGGWSRQMVSSTGFLTNLSGLARFGGYSADNVPNQTTPSGQNYPNIFQIREFAQGDVTVRYPMGRRGDGYQQIVEPITVLSFAPGISNQQNLPNEDSLDVEYDETNLFTGNRFTGIDRLEGGTRAAYGLRHALVGDNGARIEAIVGQIYRLSPNTDFPGGSGLRDNLSDYVGRLDFAPGPWFDMNYGFRLDSDSYHMQRQELQTSAGVPIFRAFANYISVNQTEANTTTSSTTGNVEEVTFGANSTFAKYWNIFASHRRALSPDPGPRLTQVGINYGDECFQMGLTAQQDSTTRLDLNSGTSVIFHFYLKNVGGVHTDSVSSPSGFMSPSIDPQTAAPITTHQSSEY